MKKTILVLLLVVATTILTLHPRKRNKKEFFITSVGTSVSKTGANIAGTVAEFGVKVSDETLDSFSKSFDDLLSGNKTIDSITDSDIEDIAKKYDAFKDTQIDYGDLTQALKDAYKSDRFKVFDDYVVDTRKLDDIDSLPEETKTKIIEDAEDRLKVKYDNLPTDQQLFKTWQEITLIRKGSGRLGDLDNADIAKTIDEYVEFRGKPLTKGSNLQVLRESLDDPSAWSRFVNAPAWRKIVAGSFIFMTVAGILIGVFVKPTYFKDSDSGTSGYDPYTGECEPGDLECVAAQWVDWLEENSTMFGLASCASMCMCICCCCMLSLVLIMDGENNNSGYL